MIRNNNGEYKYTTMLVSYNLLKYADLQTIHINAIYFFNAIHIFNAKLVN